MTLERTRQLGIEFERRVQTMIPEKEYIDKLDTDTIFSYLNQYQDRYIHEVYRNLDKLESGSKLSAHVESILQSLLRREEILVSDSKDYTGDISDMNQVVVGTGRSVVYTLDPAFYMYVRSVSKVTSTFSFRGGNKDGQSAIRVIPNQLVSQSEVWKLIETPHDTLRILRYPAAVLSPHNDNNKPTLTVIYDQYTTPTAIEVTYYAQPKHFDVMTSTACELPDDVFEDLVSGAVDLYTQYVAGAEANKRRQDEARRRAAERQQEQNNRQNNRQFEE